MTLTAQSSFADCWRAWCQAKLASRGARTRTMIESELFRSLPKFGLNVEIPIGSLGQEHINNYVNQRIKAGNAASWIRWCSKALFSFLRWCEREDIVRQFPIVKHRLPALPQRKAVRRIPFTHEEYLKLLGYLDNNPDMVDLVRERWITASQIGYWTGLRISDVSTLMWDRPSDGLGTWVVMADQVIIAHPIKKLARRERLEIPIEPPLYDGLQCAAARRVNENPYVLPGMAAEYLAGGQLCQQFSAICDKAKLQDHTFHCFRHGFVSRLVNAGVDPLIVGSMTGQSIQQIAQYTHVTHEARTMALEKAREAMATVRNAA